MKIESLVLSVMVGAPKTSGPVYQSTNADLHTRRFFGFAGLLFPVIILTQDRTDSEAFTQGLAGQADW